VVVVVGLTHRYTAFRSTVSRSSVSSMVCTKNVSTNLILLEINRLYREAPDNSATVMLYLAEIGQTVRDTRLYRSQPHAFLAAHMT
jgi:hypothetical protein